MATHTSSGKDKSIKKRLGSAAKSAQKKAKRARVRKTWADRWVNCCRVQARGRGHSMPPLFHARTFIYLHVACALRRDVNIPQHNFCLSRHSHVMCQPTDTPRLSTSRRRTDIVTSPSATSRTGPSASGSATRGNSTRPTSR